MKVKGSTKYGYTLHLFDDRLEAFRGNVCIACASALVKGTQSSGYTKVYAVHAIESGKKTNVVTLREAVDWIEYNA